MSVPSLYLDTADGAGVPSRRRLVLAAVLLIFGPKGRAGSNAADASPAVSRTSRDNRSPAGPTNPFWPGRTPLCRPTR